MLEQALALGRQPQHADRLAGQGSIFDLGSPDERAGASPGPRHHPAIPLEEFEKQELPRAREGDRSACGSPSTRSTACATRCGGRSICPIAEVSRPARRRRRDVGGIVGAIRSLTTRKGDPMAFVRLDDLSGSVEVIVFNSAYAAARELLEADRVLLVKGRVDHKDGETKLVALEVAAFEARARAPGGAAARRRAPRAGRRDPRAGRRRPRLPGRVAASSSRSRRRRARGRSQFGPGYRVRPEAGLLRRGEGAARRGRRRGLAGRPSSRSVHPRDGDAAPHRRRSARRRGAGPPASQASSETEVGPRGARFTLAASDRCAGRRERRARPPGAEGRQRPARGSRSLSATRPTVVLSVGHWDLDYVDSTMPVSTTSTLVLRVAVASTTDASRCAVERERTVTLVDSGAGDSVPSRSRRALQAVRRAVSTEAGDDLNLAISLTGGSGRPAVRIFL